MRSSTSTSTVGVNQLPASIDALATAQHPRALRDRVGALRFEHVDLRGACERTDVGALVGGITDGVRAHHFDERRDERVEHRCRARTPAQSHCTTGRRCNTRPRQPRVPHPRRRRRRPRTRGSLPPNSSCTRSSRSATCVATSPARRVRTGEAHHVDVGCDERRAGRAAANHRLHDVDRHLGAV